jgi:hypothetical protein
MAYLTISRIAGDPDELLGSWRSTVERMNEVGRDHGLILHATTPTEDGLLMVNLWPAQENADAATADPRRNAVLAQHDLKPGQFSREHHEGVEYVLFSED